ncbi:hypothetical protein AX774_g7960 [Zancudomyces culisetae]|uniref:Uncharacterized protein n=1 Tax=Zancudomyces culisetae TaxID=1213189 RepID=A0A1R1PCE0_ZANCU|nr:hypothetical protein AX774_g7960 [Zancudomyces culisetae]|eukprot:OMH78645.1 hypothetical protein AX774_g7960 [Zancudomyces culisetae]
MEQENARKKIRSIACSLVNGELVVPVGTNSRQLNGLKEQLSKFHTPVGENSQLRMEQSLYDNRNKTIRHKLTSGKLGFFFSRKKSRPTQPSQDDVHNFFDQKPVEVFQSKPIENNPPFEQRDFKIPEQDTNKLGLQSMVDIFPNFEASDTLNIESMMNKVSVMNLGDKPSTENGLKKQVDGSATIIKPVTNIHSGNKDDSDSEPDVPLSTVLTNTFGKSDGKKAKQNDLTQFTYDNLDAITANADLILDNDDLSIPYNNNGYNSKQSALNNCNNPVYTNPGQFGQGNMAMNQINTNSMIMNGMDISGQSQAGYGGVNTNSMVGINGFDQSMANIAGMQAMNDPQQMYSGNGYGNPNPMNPVEMGGQMNSNMYPINGGYDPAYGDMNVGYDGMMHHQSQDIAMLNNSYPGGLLGLAASYVPKTENVLGFPVPDEDMGGPLISVQKKTDTMQNPAGLVAAIANREQLKSDQKYRDSGSLMRGRQIKKMGETYGTVSGKSSRLGMSSSTFNQNDDTMSVVGGYANQTLGPRPATSMYFHESPHAMNENLGGSVMNGGRPLSMNVNSAFGGSVANLSAFVQNSGIGHSRSVLGYHTNHNAIDEMGVSGGSYEGFRPRSNIYGPSNSFTNLPQSFGIHANGGRPVSGIQSMGGPGFRGSTVGGKLGGYDGANRMSIMSSAGMGYPNNRLNRSSLVFNGNQPSDQTLNASIGNINAGYGIQNQQFSEEFPMNANPNRMSRVTHGFGQNSDFAPIGGNRGIHAPHNAPVFNQHLNNRNSTAFSSQLKQSSSLNSPVYQDFMIDLTITQKVAQNFEAFLDKCVDSKPYSVVTMSDVYSCYSRFCLKNGLTEEEKPNIDQFIKMLKVADWTPKENKEGESSYYNMILV